MTSHDRPWATVLARNRGAHKLRSDRFPYRPSPLRRQCRPRCDSLINVLARAQFKVLWRDNQSGCKGVCDGTPEERLDAAKVPGLCADGRCLDEVLLQGLVTVARDANGNMVVVHTTICFTPC